MSDEMETMETMRRSRNWTRAAALLFFLLMVLQSGLADRANHIASELVETLEQATPVVEKCKTVLAGLEARLDELEAEKRR